MRIAAYKVRFYSNKVEGFATSRIQENTLPYACEQTRGSEGPVALT